MDIKQIIELKLTILFSIISLIVMIATFALWRSFLHAKQAEKRAQLLEHETRLAHAARVNSMGELASGIAHELTQPLTALLSQSQAALRMEASGEHGEMLQQALTANVRQAARAGEILQRMRQYMSNKQPSHKRVEVNQAIRDVSELLQTDLTLRRITLKTQMITPSPVIVADAVEIEQVLYNLVRNAADSLDEVSKDEKQVTISSAIDDGEAIINVTDNGRGIADDILPQLFDPFFSTRQNGMGLGLSLCATLIERIGGEISAQNRPEGGALFTIIIPTAEPGSTKATA